MPKIWWVMVALALVIAGYAGATVAMGNRVFPPDLAPSFQARPWGIYPHALFGGIALALGAFQFHRGLLRRHRARHRFLGKVYLIAAIISGTAGLYMSIYSFGGLVTHFGFGLLAIVTIACPVAAYRSVRSGDIVRHREWMIRSYALIFGAVTLRIELPLLIAGFGQFPPAYQVVSWLAWVPNLVVAEAMIRARRKPTLEREILDLART